MKCPLCGKEGLKILMKEKELPYFGKCLIVSTICENCNYKFNDVFTIEFKEPRKYWLRINKEEDLFAKIVRGNNGTIEIKELGVKIQPGPQASAFIKNVEGILNDVEQVLKVQKILVKNKRKLKKIDELLKKIELMKAAKISFTISVKDPTGVSRIIHKNSSKVKSRKLSKREIKKLKTSVIIGKI